MKSMFQLMRELFIRNTKTEDKGIALYNVLICIFTFDIVQFVIDKLVTGFNILIYQNLWMVR